jgi:hypothetical protein
VGRLSFEVQNSEYKLLANTALLGKVDRLNSNKENESNCLTHSSRRKSTVSFSQTGLSLKVRKRYVSL